MVHVDPFIALLATMSMTVALVGAVLSLIQKHDQAMFRVLACFFFAMAVTEFGDAVAPSLVDVNARVVLIALWIIGAASALPLLWLYIWKLTDSGTGLPKRLWLHAITPGIACLLFGAVFVLTTDDRALLFTDALGTVSGTAFIVGAAFETYALFIITLQWLAYLILSAVRLLKYRARLKDVFASTEGKELRWVASIIVLCGGYWVYGVYVLFLDLSGRGADPLEILEYIWNLIVSGILVIWGLRQRSVLRPAETIEAAASDAPKYAKSALTDAMAARIASKLKRAMTDDRLHLDPNLSLWALSKHIGVSDNYVSQVLNEEIGQNFFDFVNSHRVSEAQTRLIGSDETILNIAYDTGFNSRSSFYTAFKKSTGQTPTEFRAQSVRPG